MPSVILAHSQTAASPVTFDLNCQDETRKVVVVVMIRVRDKEVEREAEGEEGRPTEEGGKLTNIIKHVKSLSLFRNFNFHINYSF